MALVARVKRGRGQVVDACLYESAFSLIEPHIPAYDKLGVVANRTGSRLPDSAPNNTYVTRDRRYIHVTAMGDAVFVRLSGAIGRPQLADDPKYATQVARSVNEEELDGIIGAWVERRPLDEVVSALNAAGIPAAPVYTVEDIFKDEHFEARDMLVRVPDEDFGSVALPGVVPKLSATPGEIRHTGHRVGEDTVDVLADVLGLGRDEIARLERERVVATAPLPGTRVAENAA
jgi:crotonobetainyl-CoA:carnitine CoA-transferase CaiB-like acyl-CoA transferase